MQRLLVMEQERNIEVKEGDEKDSHGPGGKHRRTCTCRTCAQKAAARKRRKLKPGRKYGFK